MPGVNPITAIAVEAFDLTWQSSKSAVVLQLGWGLSLGNTHLDDKKYLGVTHVGAPAQDAGRHRAGQQDGPVDIGDANKERIL